VRAIAEEKGVTAGQIALAWLLAQGPDVVPIPGTTTRKHLEENVAAAEIRLDGRDLARLDEAAPRDAAAGLRYPEARMETVNR
jgi:aryl-alcohol dehydrogenase-like predicted oxidoreductase